MSTYQTSFDTHLIEDYLHTTEIMVSLPNKGPKACIAPYINHNNKSEALVISQDDSGGNSIFQVVREPLSDSGWNYYGLGAQPNLMAVVDDSHIWIYGTDDKFWIFNGGQWKQQEVSHDFTVFQDRAKQDPNAYNAFVPRMSASTDGVIWCLDQDGVVFECDHNKDAPGWHRSKLIGSANLIQSPVGSSTDLYVLNNNRKIYHFNETDARNGVKIEPAGMLASMIAMGADGILWALLYQPDELPYAATLHQYDATTHTWKNFGSNQLDYITVADSNHIFGLARADQNTKPKNEEANLNLVQFNADTHTWEKIESASVIGAYVDGKMVLENSFGLVAVPGKNKCWYFDTLIKTWAGSWSTVMMPTGMRGPILTKNEANFTGNVTEVVVGLDQRVPDVTRTFFIAGEFIFYSTYLKGQAWSFPTVIENGPYHNLGLTNQMDDGSLILYAAESEQGTFLTAVQQQPALNTQWTIQKYDTKGMMKPSTTPGYPLAIALTAKNANDWCVYFNYQANLYVGFGGAQKEFEEFVKFDGDQGDVRAKGILRVPVGKEEIDHYVMVIDENDNMQVVWDINDEGGKAGGRTTQISGTGPFLPSIQVYAGVLDANNMIRIYATDRNERLWVLRQTSTTPQGDLPFGITHWHPLGDTCTYLANGPGLFATTEVFLLDNDHFLQTVKQNAVTGVWESIPVHKPKLAGEDPLYVSQYVTELLVTQPNGPTPVANLEVTINSGESIAIWHKGQQYNVGPGQPATLHTDGFGRISVSTLAFGLHTPGISFNATGFTDKVEVYPAQNVHDRLAKIDNATLQNAQKRTQGVPATSQPLVKAGAPNLGATTTAIQNTFKIASNKNIGAGSYTGANLKPGPDHQAALRQAWQSKVKSVTPEPSLSAASGGNFITDFWHSLVHFGEDVWHAIKKGVMALKQVAIDIGQGIIKLAVELEGNAQATIEFFIRTVDDIGHAVQTAFKWIEVEVKDALDWLKSVFNWEDVLATKTVLEFYLNQTLSHFVGSVAQDSPNNVQHLIETKFDQLVALIKGEGNSPGYFGQLKEQVGTQSFNGYTQSLPKQASISGGKSQLYPQNLNQHYQSNQVHCNYVHNKIHTYHNRGGSMAAAISGISSGQGDSNLTEIVANLMNSFDQTFKQAFSGETFNSQKQNVIDKLQAHFQSGSQSDIENFFEGAIADLVVVLEDITIFILGILKDVLKEVMNVVGKCMETFQKILNYQIEIPILSWLYQKISNHPLTILDVISLVFALPVTILYKVVNGTTSPPITMGNNNQGIPTVASITNTPLPWPNEYLGKTPVARSLENTVSLKSEQEEGDNTLNTMLGMVGLINSFVNVGVGIAADISESAEQNAPEVKEADGMAIVFSVIILVSELIEMGLSIPVKTIAKPYANRSLADHANIAVWASSSVPLALDLISVVGGTEKGKAMEYEEWGPWVEMSVGLMQLGVGVFAVVEYNKDDEKEYSAAASVEAILGPLPSIAKPLVQAKGEAVIGTLPTLVIIDFLCGMGSAICGLLEKLEE